MAERNAWAEYEAAIAAPPDAAARVRARLDRRLAAREHIVADGDRAQASKAAAAILVLKSSAISVAIAAATLAGLHVGARAIAPPAEPPAVVAPSHDDSAAPPLPATPVAIAPATSVAPVITSPDPVPVVEPVAPVRRGAPEAARADRLAEELALVDPARAALARGDHANALRLFGEHAQRFPNGALAPERDAYSAIARCQDGARDRKSLLAAFARAHVGSSLLDRVRDACRDSSTDSRTPPE